MAREGIVFVRKKSIYTSSGTGKVKLLDLEDELGSIYELDGYALDIWNSIDGESSWGTILQSVFTRKQIAAERREQFFSDAGAFLDELLALGWVTGR